jgi:hypothetical protein
MGLEGSSLLFPSPPQGSRCMIVATESFMKSTRVHLKENKTAGTSQDIKADAVARCVLSPKLYPSLRPLFISTLLSAHFLAQPTRSFSLLLYNDHDFHEPLFRICSAPSVSHGSTSHHWQAGQQAFEHTCCLDLFRSQRHITFPSQRHRRGEFRGPLVTNGH